MGQPYRISKCKGASEISYVGWVEGLDVLIYKWNPPVACLSPGLPIWIESDCLAECWESLHLRSTVGTSRDSAWKQISPSIQECGGVVRFANVCECGRETGSNPGKVNSEDNVYIGSVKNASQRWKVWNQYHRIFCHLPMQTRFRFDWEHGKAVFALLSDGRPRSGNSMVNRWRELIRLEEFEML